MKLMKVFCLILFCALFFGLALISPVARAQSETDELSYEDLVDQLHRKRRNVERTGNKNHTLDQLTMHAGLGLITSFNGLEVNDRRTARSLNGFQISVGIDLFSEQWVSEFVLRNFGTTQGPTETRSLREVDLTVDHRDSLADQLGYRIGGGLGTRYFRLSDTVSNVSLSDDTPCIVAFGGLEKRLNRQFSLGAELGLRSSLSDRSFDKSSLDFMVRLDTFF
ncbi:MAG: hypothetical protein C5B49_01865 [Bdellovibrio sp.]|nr:MAG: hypothetical protein C5B49_01865 [Bdellovibrio sp.]